jgi:hypothetical protein
MKNLAGVARTSVECVQLEIGKIVQESFCKRLFLINHRAVLPWLANAF